MCYLLTMNVKAVIASAVAGVAGVAVGAAAKNVGLTTPLETEASTIYEFTMKSIDGKERPLKDYEGKVLVVVNVASKCGLTPQYTGLEKLYQQNKEAGLVVLGFPANDFNGQEPGSNAEILEFCSTQYKVTFPMFSKIVVKGPNAHPLYQWLIAQVGEPKDIEWNFAKFVIGKDGKVRNRFAPQTKPDDPKFVQAVREALEAP